jgi:hypothetical protein
MGMTSKRVSLVRPLLGAVALSCGGACGSGGGGNHYSLAVGDDDGGGGAFAGADAGVSAGFDAHIEENHVTIMFVTLACAGDCATVQAVATGGLLPYSLLWDDGSTSSTRKVCPSSSTMYFVKATDTGSTGEVPRPAETVQVPLTASVLTCPDGGIADGSPGDGASDCEDLLTVTPPSGTVSGPGTQVCSANAIPGAIAAFGAPASLQARQEYEIAENVTGTLLTAAPTWDLYGAASSCSSTAGDQLLGSLTFDPGVPRQSICFRATADYAAINWSSSSIAAGAGQGIYQLCRGCGK